ncbi:uncharacterized protein LOC105771425 isoform X1 [Gossypium raimondii]|uniref:uncharacterized protein LOC105771425 isoform X1 n=1 Tax=Gossypium raimondii TaxID=29730 RepID=UPI00227D02CC|nr:uncharacterized protein LOC105771425 isoform X1 [Gossypium raimondii]
MSEQKSLGFGQTTLIPTVQDGKVNQNPSRYYNVNTYRTNGGRKRQLNDFIPISPTTSDTQDHEEEMSRTFTRHPEKHTLMLKKSDALYESKSCNKSLKSGLDASLRYRPEKTSQEKLGVEARESTQTLISVGAFPAETGGVRPVKAQLVDMKLRLQKLEREICMLKSMPRNKDRYHALSSSSGKIISGSVDPLKEGVESRTVFVTNVHVAATQDALRSYFSKCGSINRVIKLTDTSTIAQKWSAYITFANKESVDKALALNGTNFFSRIIWVSKKIQFKFVQLFFISCLTIVIHNVINKLFPPYTSNQMRHLVSLALLLLLLLLFHSGKKSRKGNSEANPLSIWQTEECYLQTKTLS